VAEKVPGFGATNLRHEVAGGVDAVRHLDSAASLSAHLEHLDKPPFAGVEAAIAQKSS
jgi:hypothetical protein